MEKLKKKPVRTISGVTPLTVVLKPRKCNHGTCVYCPGGEYTPQSYTDKSPAIMRAMALAYDPYEQTMNRLKILNKMGHPTDKIEIILLGGTFLQYEKEYKFWFVKRIYDALNGVDSDNLGDAKKINESAEHRCVAMCIENRPDNCSIEEIKEMLDFGATRVEIGVQIPDDNIYKKINRGHTVKDVIDSIKRLKDSGFKVGLHVMPGLPYSNPELDLEKFKMLFENEDFRPDQLKIYPCQIVQDSPLEKIYKKINYTPYSTEIAKNLISEMMTYIPDYCRVMRMMREIPKERMIGEPIKLDLRKEVEDTLRNSGKTIHEIRMREIGFVKSLSKNTEQILRMKVHEYNASGGREFFIEVVNDNDALFGLLRLRFPSNTFPPALPKESSTSSINNKSDNVKMDDDNLNMTVDSYNLNMGLNDIGNKSNNREMRVKGVLSGEINGNDDRSSDNLNVDGMINGFNSGENGDVGCFIEELEGCAIIRELHVYGQSLGLGIKGEDGGSQHIGIGKKLMKKAEEIAKENNFNKIAVISGVGVREYYRKLGYKLNEFYVIKDLN
jgi:elongator complex protein 3